MSDVGEGSTVTREIEARKKFLEFTEEDARRLRDLAPIAEAYAGPVIDEFYRHLLSFDVGRDYFGDPAVLQRVKEAQRQYFLDLTRGDYGPRYAAGRRRIGEVHERVGLPMDAYLGMFAFYLRHVCTRLFAELPPDQALAVSLSLGKLVFLDIELATDTYLAARERTIRAHEQVAAFSTPVLPVKEGLLLVPIVGVLDEHRARQLAELLLAGIRSYRAQVVVLDITGVPQVDAHVANHVIAAVNASRLMGASVIVSGVSAPMAMTLVELGVNFGPIATAGDLQTAMEEAEHRLRGH